jgi:preprotein translocase subunit SecA
VNIKPIADIPSPKPAARVSNSAPSFVPKETFGYTVSYSFPLQKPIFGQQPVVSETRTVQTDVAEVKPPAHSAASAPVLGTMVQEFPAAIEPAKFPGVSLIDQLKARVGFDPVGLQRLELKEVEFYEQQFSSLTTPAQFQAQTTKFREALTSGISLEEIRPQAYALARLAAKQTLQKRPFDSQMLGALAMQSKTVVQMGTGEGKTLAALMPLYLNALTGEGSHLVTVNDYLAKVGMEELEPAFKALGLSTGLVLKDQSPEDKRKAYQCDVTYVSNDTLGFDFLNDRTATDPQQQVQRAPHFALVDEIDQVLLDEARVPLIIASTQPDPNYDRLVSQGRIFKSLVAALVPGQDYRVERKDSTAYLTEIGQEVLANELAVLESVPGSGQQRAGLKKRELLREKADLSDKNPHQSRLGKIWGSLLGRAPSSSELRVKEIDQRLEQLEKLCPSINLYSEENSDRLSYLQTALEAQALFRKGRDYTVKDGQVQLIDEFKGRISEGRRLSMGLHQAIEIKEGLTPDRSSGGLTCASITYPNLLKRYPLLSGMTGTALGAKSEFNEVLGLDIVPVPARLETKRVDKPDSIFANRQDKLQALVARAKELFEEGVPVLVVSRSVAMNKAIAALLESEGISPQCLDADDVKTNTPEENAIVAGAGRSGMVTVATNMAGRGVDVKPEPINYKKLAIAADEARLDGQKVVVHFDSEQEAERLAEWFQPDKSQPALLPFQLSGEPQAGVVTFQIGPPGAVDSDCKLLNSSDFPGKKLVVLGSERNLDSRVDEQLRGRAGRQGAEGETEFFVSLDDELLQLYSNKNAQELQVDFAAGQTSELRSLTEKSQQRAENVQSSARLATHQYDAIVDGQREIFWGLRNHWLELKPSVGSATAASSEIPSVVTEFAVDAYTHFVEERLAGESSPKLEELNGALQAACKEFGLPVQLEKSSSGWKQQLSEKLRERLTSVHQHLTAHQGAVPQNSVADFEWRNLLGSLDEGWTSQIQYLEDEKRNAPLDSFIGKEPQQAYLERANLDFDSMWKWVKADMTRKILPELLSSYRVTGGRDRELE